MQCLNMEIEKLKFLLEVTAVVHQNNLVQEPIKSTLSPAMQNIKNPFCNLTLAISALFCLLHGIPLEIEIPKWCLRSHRFGDQSSQSALDLHYYSSNSFLLSPSGCPPTTRGGACFWKTILHVKALLFSLVAQAVCGNFFHKSE